MVWSAWMLARVQYPFPAVSSALKPVRECQSELLRTARRRDDRRRQRRRDRRDRRHRQGGAEMVNSNLAIASEREVLYTVEITFKWVLSYLSWQFYMFKTSFFL